MDAYEATKVVFARVQALHPDLASKIMGMLLIQDKSEEDMIRLAFGPEHLLHAVVARARADLAAAADVEAEIRGRCAELESSVAELSARLADVVAAYSSSLGAAGSALRSVRGGLAALKASTDKTGILSKCSWNYPISSFPS